MVERTLAERGLNVDVAFCPEHIAEGNAMVELFTLPQLVGARVTIGFISEPQRCSGCSPKRS